MICSRMQSGVGKTNFRFRAFLCLGACLTAGVLAGCSRCQEEPAWFQSTDIRGEEDLLNKIQSVDCLFALESMRREYVLRENEPSQAVLEALDSRAGRLVAEAEVFPAIPGALDFLGWKIERIGSGSAKQKTDDRRKYRVSGYFVVTGRMDRDWIFKIMTKVDDQHVFLLPPDRQKAKYLNWQIYPKTSTWKPGEHYVLSTTVELKPIPYYIFARMFLYPELINHDVFAYGWFADPDEAPAED